VDYKDNDIVTEFFNGGPAVRIKVYYSDYTTQINDPIGDQPGNFTIYPNPADKSLTIVPANPEIEIEQLQIVDLSGKEQQAIFTDNQVDISKLQNGCYLLKLTTSDGQTETKKIVKQ
jgi:hypothetical protein